MAISSPAHSEDAAPVTGGRLWLAFGLIAVLIAAAALVAAADLGRSRAVGATQARADDAATLANAVLRGELEKQRALPVILTRDPDVRSALTGGDLPALDLKLEAIARETRTAVIYLLDAGGKAISASNWREPTSFVGNDYAFRDYFTEAVAKGGAEQFALGTVSNRPGLYITSRISEGDRLLGVIVVKVEFDRVEADWRALGGQTYVADARGVVLLSTVADWRFRTEAALAPDVATNVRRSLQFGAAPLSPLPLAAEGDIVRGTPPFAGLHVAARIAVPTTDWHLEVLLPVDRAIRSEQWDLRVLAALFLMPSAALAAFLLRRRQHASVRRRAEAQIKAELERRVEERTAALAASNAQLVDEMTERARAQERLSDTREELAKANRLATLGQVTAGVAHEINQPLAAIRTYGENARGLLQRQDGSAAQVALGKVVALTERIGAITETLRGFARRGGGPLEPVALDDAIAGALMILDAPLRHAGIVPAVDPVPPGLKVQARTVELEQVLVNLLRNAIEAIGNPDPKSPGGVPGNSLSPLGRGGPRSGSVRGDTVAERQEAPRPNPLLGEREQVASPVLALGIRAGDDEITLTVADRGPGLDEAGLAGLFTPFRSTKPRGLGLGLVISHDIVTGFGGTLTAAGRPGEGCVFTIRLKRAQ